MASPLAQALCGSILVTAAAAMSGCSSNQLLAVGAKPPELTAVDQHGKVQRLGAERGHPVVVYFYPKDGTPGCTEQACAFRDAWDRFEKAKVQVFGVSGDDRESKQEFAEEYELPFPILADTDGTWAEAFGVGSTLGYYSRVTFLLDGDGRVSQVYPDVDPAVNATEVLSDASKLSP